MRYYLDTVAIRKLSRELNGIKDRCYTSALCIFELISGINQKEFSARKKALENLFNSGIQIIWELPEAMKTYAFPLVEIQESRTPGLKMLSNHLLKSADIDEFISNTRDHIYSQDFFNELDGIYSSGFITATSRGNQTLKEIFQQIREKDGEVFEKIAKDYLRSLATDPINRQITISAIANNLAAGVRKSGDQIEVTEVIESYNGSIDVFIDAFSLYTIQKSALFNSPSKNDFVDLHHLLYLGNEQKDCIVTDDKMILEITPYSISIDGFKNIIANF
ncbi:hypothetical protein ASC72_21155 [Flavobacterium sp. Root420]|nr:hypothetical protein ASC72_21155 [Flavobacterium sp. Root420]